MIFFQSIQSVLSIIIMIALGYLLKRQGWFDESFGKSISSLITRVALPASIFVSVLKNLTKESLFQLSGSLIYPVGAVIIFYFLAYGLVKILKIRPGRRGIFMNAVVNANTIFIGLPLNIALFGEKALPYFLVYYVTNTVSTWAFGVFLISNDDPTKVKGETKAKLNWKKLLPPPSYFLVYYVTNTVSTWAFGVFLISNDDPTKVKGETKAKLNWKKLLPPPLLGFIAAIIFLLIGIPVPSFINATLGYVGSIVTPLSLLYIGIVLYDAGLKSIRAIIFLLIGIPVPSFINATLGYVGSIVTPLSLLYIGIVLYDAGLKSIRFDRDTVVALLGRFVLAPAVLIGLIALGSNAFGANLAPLLKQTLIVQSATPMLAVLPILANEAHGDVKYATNLVTTSTILFVVVVPILMQLVQFI